MARLLITFGVPLSEGEGKEQAGDIAEQIYTEWCGIGNDQNSRFDVELLEATYDPEGNVDERT